tara:strand:+ start:420 stop:608 length:189 start_codon:yes stop_codon:yes gene_type:complete
MLKTNLIWVDDDFVWMTDEELEIHREETTKRETIALQDDFEDFDWLNRSEDQDLDFEISSNT